MKQQSRTLPRCRPSQAPPPVPNKYAPSNRSVDVHRLKDEIDKLSQQLLMVKAQLHTRISDESNEEANTTSRSVQSTLDSRLSTVLCSPFDTDCSPTPQPTLTPLPESVVKNPLSLCSSACSNTPTPKAKRASVRIKPMDATLPRISHRQTISHLDLSSRPTSVTQTLSGIYSKAAGSLDNVGAPPKPLRTFRDNPRQFHRSSMVHCKGAPDEATSTPYHCTEEQFLDAILEKFPQGTCWYMNNGRLFFVNPYSDISSSKRRLSPAISSISVSLLKQRNAALILRGVSGSGKSQISELICLDIAKRFCPRGTIFAILDAAFVALRPFITINNKHNNQSSTALAHTEFCIRNGRLMCVRLKHFMLDSPSRACRANIFAMLANDLDEYDKENYRISGFRLKDDHQGFGNVADLRSSLTQLGISHEDIFKVISACILLNNLSFKEMNGTVDVENLSDLEDACALLGTSALAMYRAIMKSTLTAKCSIRECQLTRDQLVSAIYTRVLRMILMRANTSLGSLMGFEENIEKRARAILDPLDPLDPLHPIAVGQVSDPTNSEADEVDQADDWIKFGSNGWSSTDSRTVHVVDAPGYITNKTNSLSELLINTINDSLAGHSTDKVSQLLQRIELTSKVHGSSSMRRRTTTAIQHSNGQLEVNYDFTRMYQRNENVVARDLWDSVSYFVSSFTKVLYQDLTNLRFRMDGAFKVFLFDARSCAFQFVVKLFASDVERMCADENLEPSSLTLELDTSTLIQSVLEHTNRLQQELSELTIRHCICLRSNDRVEYCRIQESCISRQLGLFGVSSPSTSNMCSSWTVLPNLSAEVDIQPPVPSPRMYEVRERKKHVFPQRRNVIVDFHDQHSGAVLRAGDVVKAMGFVGDAYVVETGRRVRAVIPISYTEKSLPPTEGYNV